MTVEDRLRATTEAVTAAMRPVRPLDLRPRAAEAGAQADAETPARRLRSRLPRRRPGLLAPVAAAAAVIAVAATLVAVRSLSAGPGPAATPTATSTASLPGGVPRYYVALTDIGTSKGGAPVRNAFLADAATGKRLATFTPPSDAMFTGTAGSSDGTTFVLEAEEGSHLGPAGSMRTGTVAQSDVWYVLRLPRGAADQARLTRVPIASSPGAAGTESFAVSPDGSTLAVLSQPAGDAGITVKAAGPTTLRTYSLATGRLSHTWTAAASSASLDAFADLSWLDDGHTLAFVYSNIAAQRYVRTLNVASPGTSLLADSRAVFSVPAGHPCDGSPLMTADGKAVICGVFAANSGWCATGQLALNVYSVATGKLENVLYRYQGGCHFGTAQVVWAKSATLAVAMITVSKPVNPAQPVTNTVGVATPGKFTAVPVNVVGAVTLLGGAYGPGTIAF